jgi:uncharacterized membrane protein (DUF106 family)
LNAKITLAKKRAPDYLAKWQERRKELKQKRINRMKEKELEKLKKDAQHLQNKQNALDYVSVHKWILVAWVHRLTYDNHLVAGFS